MNIDWATVLALLFGPVEAIGIMAIANLWSASAPLCVSVAMAGDHAVPDRWQSALVGWCLCANFHRSHTHARRHRADYRNNFIHGMELARATGQVG